VQAFLNQVQTLLDAGILMQAHADSGLFPAGVLPAIHQEASATLPTSALIAALIGFGNAGQRSTISARSESA
jgi:hypothetical protein